MKPRPLIALVLGTVLLMSFLSVLVPVGSEASPRALPTRPEDVTPSPPPHGDDDKKDDKPAGAHIALHVPSAPAGLWTVVQWQDSAGGWHDIGGWSGTLDEGGQKVWWVGEADFSKGPFRWLVYQGRGGKLLAQSEPFYLPTSAGETVKIEVSLTSPQPAQRSTSISTLPYPSADGSYIELRVYPPQAGLWTIVQWQDSAGGWHDIEGWSGTLDEGGQKVWWVAPAIFGEGPFRWAVYQGQGGKLLAQSEPFYLPYSAGETVKIEVSLTSPQPAQRSMSISTLPYPSADGSYIELRVHPPQAGLWTVIQWQDSAGGWHDIEGWSGSLDEGGQKVWWVAPAIFGEGSFRWAVYQGQGGQLLATSDSFYLPGSAGKKVRVGMALSQ